MYEAFWFAIGAGAASLIWFIRVRSWKTTVQYAKEGVDKIKETVR